LTYSGSFSAGVISIEFDGGVAQLVRAAES
jgi:hypothetical protein